MTNSMKGLDPKALEAAIEAWRPVMGLSPGQYLQVPRYDKDKDGSITDILIPFGETMMGAMRAAITAYLSALPEPGAEAEGVEHVGWRVRDKHLQGRQWRLVVDLSAIPFTDRDLYEIVPAYVLAASPAFPTPASPKTRVTSIDYHAYRVAHIDPPARVTEEVVERPDLQQRLVEALYGPGVRRSDSIEELADALIAVRRPLKNEQAIGYVDRLSEPTRISFFEKPGLEMPVFAYPFGVAEPLSALTPEAEKGDGE